MIKKSKVKEIVDYCAENGEQKTLNYFNIKSETLNRYKRLYNNTYNEQKNEDYYKDIIEDEKKARIVEAQIAGIKTTEELIKYANIDMTKWKITKQVLNRWGNFDNSNYQIKVWLSLIEDFNSKKEFDYWINLFEKKVLEYETKKIIPIEFNYDIKKINVMLEITLVDHHLGQLSWGKETGYGNYDIKIARRLYMDAVKYLIIQVNQYNIEEILFIIGNDFFNVNSYSNTTLKGTPQDEDCRWQKSFNYGVDLFIEVIDFLKTLSPKIHVKQIPGNHDFERIYYAGAFLKAYYRNDSQVFIDNEPKSRKYYLYGKNLIGFTHGDNIRKMDRLIALMPLEVKEYWALSNNREWHTGHCHHETKKILILDTEETGVKVRTLSTLVEPDAWHALHGFVSDRQSQAFVWHKEKGQIAEFKYRP